MILQQLLVDGKMLIVNSSVVAEFTPLIERYVQLLISQTTEAPRQLAASRCEYELALRRTQAEILYLVLLHKIRFYLFSLHRVIKHAILYPSHAANFVNFISPPLANIVLRMLLSISRTPLLAS